MRRNLTCASLVAIVRKQQETTLTRSQGSQIIDNNRSNNDSEIIDRHRKIDMTLSRPMTNKEGEKENLKETRGRQ
jgi:hypothetical protein